MSVGDVFGVGEELFCQLGGNTGTQKAPFVPLYYTDDYNSTISYGCDERTNRYTISPQGNGKYPQFAMMANLSQTRLLETSEMNEQKGHIEVSVMHLLCNCAMRQAKQKVKKVISQSL